MGLHRRELQLQSAIARVRPGGPFTPDNLGASLLSWQESVSGDVFTTLSAPCTNGDTILKRTDRRDTLSVQAYPLANNGAVAPTWTAANKAAAYSGTSSLVLNSAVTLTGPYTLYAVGSRAASSIWVPFGYSAVDQAWMIFSDNMVYFIPPAAVSFTGGTGLILARFRRDAVNTIFFAATGMAEVQVGAAFVGVGTFHIDTEGNRPLGSQFTTNGNDHRASLIVLADTVTNGTDAAIQKYLGATFGVTL